MFSALDHRPLTLGCLYALAFGLFLGLAILKFGNPVILDNEITEPNSLSEIWTDFWPTHWANWFLFLLAAAGVILALSKRIPRPQSKWLWLPPLFWFSWQLASATATVDSGLTATTLCQFAGCIACYFLGAFFFGSRRALNLLLTGILAAFTLCLIRAIDQRLFEFRQTRQLLVESERQHWTNLPPGMVLEMKRDGSILTTNGVDVVNPELLKRLSEGRVSGTLVYSNALAGVILLLFPVTLVFILNSTGKMKPPIRFAAMALALFLGSAGFFWTGSKFGWLIAIGLGGLCLLRLRWPLKLKIAAVAIVAVLGLGIFAVRFDHYFAKGATSVVARFDYWRAAVQTTLANPLLGTGPGTFQRPYAEIKSPDAEMTRLTHNDYLEQFSDSGIPGGIFYATWIFLELAVAGKKIWRAGNPIMFALLLGLLGWFIQGFGEFGLYIPASAWTAFTLLGCLLALSGNPMDKPAAAN